MKIYEDAIPASERKSRARIMAMMRDVHYSFLGAVLAGRLIGFAIVYCFRGERLSLLEYMGVEPVHRSKGIGGDLFQTVLGLLDPGTPLLVEVDSDLEWSHDHAQRVKRKRFYGRLGCRELADLVYLLPIGDRPPAMNLLVHNVKGGSVDRGTVLQWLIRLYVDVYERPVSDPRIAAMVASLPEKVALI